MLGLSSVSQREGAADPETRPVMVPPTVYRLPHVTVKGCELPDAVA
jgi:hypothetical protein